MLVSDPVARGSPRRRKAEPRSQSRLASSSVLLTRARQGDRIARDELAIRYVDVLRRFAHGRLPPWARTLKDTEDLVQDTVLRALEHVDTFVPRREGAFLAYLRQIVLNQIRDEVRRVIHRAERAGPPDELPAGEPSPLDRAIGNQAVEMYEAALSGLREKEREAVIMRVELGYSYEEVARALGKRTTSAARMVVIRALHRMSELLTPGEIP